MPHESICNIAFRAQDISRHCREPIAEYGCSHAAINIHYLFAILLEIIYLLAAAIYSCKLMLPSILYLPLLAHFILTHYVPPHASLPAK